MDRHVRAAPNPPPRERAFKRVRRGGPWGGPEGPAGPPSLPFALARGVPRLGGGWARTASPPASYGPEEAFKNLGNHQYLAVFLAGPDRA